MKTIHKYEVPGAGEFTLELPRDAQILDVQVQHGKPYLWVVVDTNKPMEQREFLVFGTGHQLPDNTEEMFWLGTFQLNGGALVFHLFEPYEVGTEEELPELGDGPGEES